MKEGREVLERIKEEGSKRKGREESLKWRMRKRKEERAGLENRQMREG